MFGNIYQINVSPLYNNATIEFYQNIQFAVTFVDPFIVDGSLMVLKITDI
jgi:hypothetical protein